MTRLTLGGAQLVVYEVEDETELELYRIVRTDVGESSEFVDSFRSHYELGAPPRRLERRSAIIHMGLSTYRSRSQAAGTARRFPIIGAYLARLRLVPGRGFNFADTAHPGHVSVWGDPLALAASVVDIQIVGS
jgi:hypothetical protein